MEANVYHLLPLSVDLGMLRQRLAIFMPRPLNSSVRFFVTPFNRFGDIHNWSRGFGEETNLMSLPEKELQFLGLPSVSTNLII